MFRQHWLLKRSQRIERSCFLKNGPRAERSNNNQQGAEEESLNKVCKHCNAPNTKLFLSQGHVQKAYKPSTFKLNDNSTFSGIMKGVEQNGKLIVWTEDEIIKTFDLKEITLLY